MSLIQMAVFFLFLSSALNLSAQNYTLSGYVRDSASGEELIGASVLVKEVGAGAVTNAYGFYSISVQAGSYKIVVSYLGYKQIQKSIELDASKRINFTMSPVSISTKEVEVKAQRNKENIESAEMGTVELDMQQAKTIPVVFGEVDILKTLQLLPGVQSAGEGNSGFYVRGGGPDQNLILLDEAPVYNTGHLFGFFSVFNSDAIKSTKLIKGGMPAKYGGRLSSVVDISMKDGNYKKYQATGGIGLISSRLMVEGPLQKDKSAFMISGRRTYIDALVKPFDKQLGIEGDGYYFYDLNAKVNYRFSDNDRVFLSGYFGRDVFEYGNPNRSFNIKIPWGNSTVTARWNHLFNSRLFMNVSGIYNDYDFKVVAGQENWNFEFFSGIKDWNLKADFSYFPGPRHKIAFGANYIFHTFTPSTASGKSDEGVEIETDSITKKYAHEAAVYVQDEYALNEDLKINAGLRFSAFQQLGPYTYFINDIKTGEYGKFDKVATYAGLEPRLSLRYKTGPQSSVKAGIALTKQYIHLVTNSGTTLPTDIWVPSTKNVKPQSATQYSIGYFRDFNDNKIEASVEFYYKHLNNQIEFRDGYIPDIGREIERDFVYGSGESFGMEIFLNKKFGKLTGWIGYTLSKTTRFFDDLQTKVFPAKYDRRHDLAIVAVYDLNQRWSFGSTFIFGTGNTTTIPERWYLLGGDINFEYIDRNSYRLEPYHRLDISATLKSKPGKKYESSWVFSVYNVYCRLNPYFIYYETDGNVFEGNLNVQAKKVALFPVIPSVTYNFKF